MSCFSCMSNRKRIDNDNGIRPYSRSSNASSGGSSKGKAKSVSSGRVSKKSWLGKSRCEKEKAKSSTDGTRPKSTAASSFTFRQLATATGNFKQINLIGEGGFGRVYKGRLETGQIVGFYEFVEQIVAVKQLNHDGHQGFQEFIVEVLMLSLLHHPNLVKLIGYCTDGDQRLLVYDYMPMGSLEDHLFDLEAGKQPLSWDTRIKIAAGAARGLEYLHCKANPPVIYRDLKSANILLDGEFNPKLSDFGLAKLGPVGDNTHVSTRVMGTYGYCAPEYAMSGKLTLRSDIYSFGVVLLELITGRKAIDSTKKTGEQNLVSWSRPFLKDKRKYIQLVDPLLEGRFPIRCLQHAVAITAMCLQEQPTFRPLISDIVVALEYLSHQSTSPEAKARIRNSASGPSLPKNSHLSSAEDIRPCASSS